MKGDWKLSGSPLMSGDSGVTGTDGRATIGTAKTREATSGDEFEFAVTNVTHPTLDYEPGSNVVSEGSAVWNDAGGGGGKGKKKK